MGEKRSSHPHPHPPPVSHRGRGKAAMGAVFYFALAPVLLSWAAAGWFARLACEGQRRSRRQPLELPSVVGLPHVTQPIVEPVFPAVPEFDHPRG
jgi:hypothetical protein